MKIILLFLIPLMSFHSFASKPPVLTEKKIRSGDTLYSLLKKYKFNDSQLRMALNQNPLPRNKKLQIGDQYYIQSTPGESKFELLFLDKEREVSYVFWKQAKEKAGALKKKEQFRRTIHEVSGRVHGSILASILKKVNSDEVAYRFMDAFVYEYNLKKQVQRNAPFSITFEKVFKGNTFIKYGEILKASIKVKDKQVTKYFVKTPDGGFFYNEKSKLSQRPLYSPVSYQKVTSLFQPRRLHPIKKRRQPHLGVDFELPTGEKIFSVFEGHVVKKGRRRGAGRYIVVKHPNGYTSYYNHMSAFNEELKVGDFVAPGKLVGYIGCSGYCTKPHLHFAVKKNGRYINPLPLLKNYTRGQYVSHFRKAKSLISKADDN